MTEKWNDYKFSQVYNDPKLLAEFIGDFNARFGMNVKPCQDCSGTMYTYWIQWFKPAANFFFSHDDCKCGYKLKEGHMIHWKGRDYVNKNLTKEIAQEILKEQPGFAQFFSEIPKQEPEPEPKEEGVTLTFQATKIEPKPKVTRTRKRK